MRTKLQNVIRLVLAIAAMTSPALAAAFQLEVVAAPGQAAAATSNDAYIIVRIANPDGTPKDNAKLETRQGPTGGGLELKNSNWGFQTLVVPPGYSGRVGNAQKQFEVNGQIRLVEMTSLGKGVFAFRVQPLFGLQGQRKGGLRWVPGEYVFRVSYQEDGTEGVALGKLMIR